MSKISFRSIIERILRSQPELRTASDEIFISAVREAAKTSGFNAGNVPRAWNLLRARYDILAKWSGKKKKPLLKGVANLLNKARHSALEAVAAYNNPMSSFRSGSFIVHMHIAWTSLLLAILLQRKVKPYYKPQISMGSRKKERRWWELGTCSKEYWQGECPASKNIEFFIGLRNKIEHGLMPELDIEIFGECQAHLINFENVLVKEFGESYALLETLAMSLQFSQIRNGNKNKAIRNLHSTLTPEIRNYIDQFRSGLTTEIFSDKEYSFKVFLVPNTGNHRSKDALAVEFVHYDTLEPEEADDYRRIAALIKERKVPVANLDKMKAGKVAKLVAAAIAPLEFTASSHHSRCWKYYQVRPPKGAAKPDACNTKYCIYDEPHGDYVYTTEWVDLLIAELSDPEKYRAIMSG